MRDQRVETNQPVEYDGFLMVLSSYALISIANFYQLCLLEDICSLSGRPGSPSDSALLSSTTGDLTLRMIPIAQTQAPCVPHTRQKKSFSLSGFIFPALCLTHYHIMCSLLLHFTSQIFTRVFFTSPSAVLPHPQASFSGVLSLLMT